MGMYTMSLMGVIDAYAGNLEDSLEKTTAKYRVSTGRKILLDNVKLPSSPHSGEFVDKFIRGFIIQNLYENIIYDTAERWLLRFQLDVEIKLPLYIAKYEALQNVKVSELDRLGKVTSSGDSSSNSISSSKSISSAYPQHISKSNDINSVKYMDSGNMSEADSKSKADSKSETVNYGNVLDRIDQLNKAQQNIIQEAIDSFNNLFMFVY